MQTTSTASACSYHGDDIVQATCGKHVVTSILYYWCTNKHTPANMDNNDTNTHTHTPI